MRKQAALFMGILLLLSVISGCAGNAAPEPGLTAEIILSQTYIMVQGQGVTVDGTVATITRGGSYRLTGSLSGGQIIVDADRDDTVELILNGVSITTSKTAAIYAKKAGQTIITLADGTENVISDMPADMLENAADDEPNAALFAKDDLYIRGSGTLTVHGSRQNGIATRDHLVIEGGILIIDAQNNGMHGRDSVSVRGGRITVTAGNDGIQSDNEGSGTVTIESGVIYITSGHDGIQAQGLLIISGGELKIVAGGGHAAGSLTSGESRKALKSADGIQISGGTVNADSLDDAMHAGNSVTISSGTLTLFSGDDGMHADETLHITGGAIDILSCYEGLESVDISISGGTVSVFSTDDGINAAISPQQSSDGNRADDTTLRVDISGGVIRINAYGDGIDSNGTVTMTGGELYISGPVSSRSGALDYDNSFRISGGRLAAAGSVGMAQTPGQSSSQPSVIVYFSQTQPAGATYLLTNASGAVILSITSDKEFQCIVLSAPELKVGDRYALYESRNGSLPGATELYDFAISGTITTVGDAQ